MTRDQKTHLLEEIEKLPDSLLREVYDFVEFLHSRGSAEMLELATASEPSLAGDWLLPEEDAAWRNL